MAILERFIITEMVSPFLFALALFTTIIAAISTLFELIRLATESGVAIPLVLQIFALQLPTFIVLAMPMAMLLTPLIVYSNLNRSSELMALRGCGISAVRLAIPVLLVSILVTGLNFWLNDAIAPRTTHAAAITLNTALGRHQFTHRDGNIFYREFSGNTLSRIFYARRFDGQDMKQVTVLNFNQGRLEEIVVADSARWQSESKLWKFLKGTLYSLTPQKSFSGISQFGQRQLSLPPTPQEFATETRDTAQMNIAEAQNFLQLVAQTGNQKWMRRLQVEIQHKAAVPFTCLFAGLVGAALGVRSRHRRSNSKGFGLSVVIIFSYYLLDAICISLGNGGLLSPAIAAWLPIVLGLMTGGYLLVHGDG